MDWSKKPGMVITMKKLSSLFHNISFRQRVVLITCLSLFVPTLILGASLLHNLRLGKTNEIIAQNQAALSNNAEKIRELYVKNIDRMVYIANNTQILSILRDERAKDLSMIWDEYHILVSILDALEVYDNQNDITIYTLNKSLYTNRYIADAGELDAGVKEKLLEAEYPAPYWRYDWGDGGGAPMIYLYRKLMYVNKPMAFVEIKIPFDKILNCLEPELPESGFIAYQTEAAGRYVYTAGKPDDGYGNLLDNYTNTGVDAGYYTLTESLGINGDKLLYFLPAGSVNTELRSVFTPIILTVTSLSVLLLAICAILISKALTGRLEKLLLKTNRDVEQYIINNRTDTMVSGNDEFAVIEKRYNELVKRVSGYYQEINNLEMDLLQASVNPHFLYNALGALKWYSEDEKFNEVIDGLINYYRTVLNRGERVIPLKMELDCLAQYLGVQKFVYKCGFSYSITAEEQISGYTVPKNLLLPVAENAFQHGIRPNGGNGRIDISCGESQGKLIIQIRDDGPGMDEQTLGNLLTGQGGTFYKGYGMVNVRKRLIAFYGREASIGVDSSPGRGTTVKLVLPIC